MERVTSLRRLVPLALLWLHCRPAGNARQSTGLSDSIVRASSPAKKPSRLAGLFYGAGDEARTRYLHLGKVALYRMSYTRIGIGCQPSEPNLFDSHESDLYGASGRNRTNDTRIFSPLLYLLSYRGIWRHAHCRSIPGSWFIILWVFPFVNNFLQKSKGYADPPQSCGKFGMGACCNSIAFIL